MNQIVAADIQSRSAAKLAVIAMLTSFAALYRLWFTADDAEAWKQVYIDALVTDENCSADDIAAGTRKIIKRWKFREAPRPADVLAAICEAQGERRTPVMDGSCKPFKDDLANRCMLCGSARGEFGALAAGNLALYRDAGPGADAPWLRVEHVCGHNAVWLAELNAKGWSTLSQLPREERYHACGFAVPGPANALRKVMDALGDKMAARREAR